MGLAASQARLLTITTRKADCEYQSMRLSHQKIALSRDMTTLSNEYQNSLTKTKLVYDFYGTGDTSTPLSYSLMMSPSILNNNVPIMLTNAEGRVVLDAKYAAAARAAGIPQEGIDGYPSEAIRNAFLLALGDQGIISKTLAESLTNITYDPTTGCGSTPGERIITEQGNFNALKDRLIENSTDAITLGANFDDVKAMAQQAGGDNTSNECGGLDGTGLTVIPEGGTVNINPSTDNGDHDFTIADFLNNEVIWYGTCDNGKDRGTGDDAAATIVDRLVNQLIPWLNEQLTAVLDIGSDTDEAVKQANALEYAVTETLAYYQNLVYNTNSNDGWNYTDGNRFENQHKKWSNSVKGVSNIINSDSELGFIHSDQKTGWGWGVIKRDSALTAINISNIVDVYLTKFAESLDNLDSDYNVAFGAYSKNSSNLVTDDGEYLYTFRVGSEYSSANLAASQFYDALFNQLCERGWVESGVDKNGESLVHDTEYIQEMLANGMMYMTTMDDDGYYYQGNYSTNSYVKEIPDEDAIALAEAKYQTEKQKINSKEETIDMKMKNLDTEISSLTTEYDTVKSVISKNIEKSFKRYEA